MKAKTVNEALGDFLKPKSDEDVKKHLSNIPLQQAVKDLKAYNRPDLLKEIIKKEDPRILLGYQEILNSKEALDVIFANTDINYDDYPTGYFKKLWDDSGSVEVLKNLIKHGETTLKREWNEVKNKSIWYRQREKFASVVSLLGPKAKKEVMDAVYDLYDPYDSFKYILKSGYVTPKEMYNFLKDQSKTPERVGYNNHMSKRDSLILELIENYDDQINMPKLAKLKLGLRYRNEKIIEQHLSELKKLPDNTQISAAVLFPGIIDYDDLKVNWDKVNPSFRTISFFIENGENEIAEKLIRSKNLSDSTKKSLIANKDDYSIGIEEIIDKYVGAVSVDPNFKNGQALKDAYNEADLEKFVALVNNPEFKELTAQRVGNWIGNPYGSNVDEEIAYQFMKPLINKVNKNRDILYGFLERAGQNHHIGIAKALVEDKTAVKTLSFH